MTKRLDPEIKALRAIQRALDPLSPEQRKRSLEWVTAKHSGKTWVSLPEFKDSQSEALPQAGEPRD